MNYVASNWKIQMKCIISRQNLNDKNDPRESRKYEWSFIIEEIGKVIVSIFHQKKRKTKTIISIFREVKGMHGMRTEQYEKGSIENKDQERTQKF